MGHRITIARTPEEQAEFVRRAADLATYGGVTVVLANDPDNPNGVAASLNINRRGCPCFVAVAEALMEIGAQLALMHDSGPCGEW